MMIPFVFWLGPIASIFWLDEELCSDIYLDGKSQFAVGLKLLSNFDFGHFGTFNVPRSAHHDRSTGKAVL